LLYISQSKALFHWNLDLAADDHGEQVVGGACVPSRVAMWVNSVGRLA
jgi:hypothetical protein